MLKKIRDFFFADEESKNTTSVDSTAATAEVEAKRKKDLEKLMEYENKIKGGVHQQSSPQSEEQADMADLALKMKNPFRGE